MGDKTTGGLDRFRLIAAFLVVAIHTSPLSSYSVEADFFLTRILARLAVPFFFLVTGRFVLAEYLAENKASFTPILRYLKKILILYGISILLYLPIGVYAGHYNELTPFSFLRMLLFDGTFYHLWYFPALIIGILLLSSLRRFCSLRAVSVVCGLLYFIALLGDSYWGIASRIPAVSNAYESLFQCFSYTRNGLLMAPIFLLLGVRLRNIKPDSISKCVAGFLITFALMTAEGFLLRHYGVQRHDSMYLLLPVCSVFLYVLLLNWRCNPSGRLRTLSGWIYILHPAVIILVRGIAKTTNTVWLLIENSMAHYLTVCVMTLLLSWLLCTILARYRRAPFEKNRAWIELDYQALKHNILVLQSLLPEGCDLMPVLKANAYGHGAVQIARALKRMGIDAFCVACISEGIELRRKGIRGEILILGYTHPEQMALLRRYRLTQTVIDFDYAVKLNQCGKKLSVHLGIDTGMHRLGERAEHLERLCEILELPNLVVKGAFTHLCAVDQEDLKSQSFTRKQAQVFYSTLDALRARGYRLPKVHLLSSYGALNYPEFAGDYARVGIALYGVKSAEKDYDRFHVDLHPVLSLKARIASVRELCTGESAGYDFSFTADHPARIATLTIGYADGYPRILSRGNGCVLIHGRRAPVAGLICMDQMMVDITDIPDVHEGDIAVLIGTSEGKTIFAYEVAERAGTITNEILSRLGARINRVWT